MPIFYDIHPSLDFLVYIFKGECNAQEYFTLYHSIYDRDARRHHGMKIIMDLSRSEFYFDVENLHEATAIMVDNKNNGHPRDHVAIISKSAGMKQATDALELMSNDLPMDLDVFHNFQDAVRWLGLAEHEQEATLFWQSLSQAKM